MSNFNHNYVKKAACGMWWMGEEKHKMCDIRVLLIHVNRRWQNSGSAVAESGFFCMSCIWNATENMFVLGMTVFCSVCWKIFAILLVWYLQCSLRSGEERGSGPWPGAPPSSLENPPPLFHLLLLLFHLIIKVIIIIWPGAPPSSLENPPSPSPVRYSLF